MGYNNIENSFEDLLVHIKKISNNYSNNQKLSSDINNEINLLINKFNNYAEYISKENKHKKDTEKEINIINSKLKESQNKYKELTDLLPQIVFELDLEGKIKFFSKAAYNITGYGPDDFYENLNIFDFLIPDDKTRALENLKNDILKKSVSIREYNIIRKDGKILPLLVYLSPLMKERKPTGLIGIGVDITLIKKAEAEIISEREKLYVTLENIGDGVITINNKKNIILLNKVAEDLTGWDNNQVIGKNVELILAPIKDTEKKMIINHINESIKKGLKINSYKNITFKDKEKILNYRIAPILNKQKEINGAVIVLKDITEKNTLEKELLRSQKHESIGILAGGIAHDFNNILISILGNLELVKLQTAKSEPSYELITSALNAATHARELTKQLLSFSKDNSPNKKVVSIKDLLKNISSFSLHGTNIISEYNIPKDLWNVEVDQDQITQVISNIIINASQSMLNGGKIYINAENVIIDENENPYKNPGKYIKISIKDEGCGIKKEYLDKIFDPYFTTKEKGSGLGLTTSYSIIKKHEGYIDVLSTTGQGSVFYIFIPAIIKEINLSNKPEKDIKYGSGRILIVDDDAFVLKTIEKMLDFLQFTYVCTRSGEEGIKIYKEALKNKKPFNIIILDLTIPGGIGGKEIIEKLKKINPNIKAIVSSGYSNDPVMANYKNYGFCDVLSKPYTVEELSAVLNRI